MKLLVFVAFAAMIATAALLMALREKSEMPPPQAKRTGAVPSPGAASSPAVVEPAPLSLPLGDPRIIVYKSQRRLELYSASSLVRAFHVGLGYNPVDDKTREGDGCTPEGNFYVFTRNAKSNYYLSLGLSYPNADDAARGLRDGLITVDQHDRIIRALQKHVAPPQDTPLGGLIYIHGGGSATDWTLGCIALENTVVKELFDAVPVGTPVEIRH